MHQRAKQAPLELVDQKKSVTSPGPPQFDQGRDYLLHRAESECDYAHFLGETVRSFRCCRFSKNHHDVYAVPEDRIMPARTFPKLPSFAPISAVPDCYFSLKTEHSVALLRETDIWAHAPCFMLRSSSIVRPLRSAGAGGMSRAILLPLGLGSVTAPRRKID